eukprot:gene9765-15158_t
MEEAAISAAVRQKLAELQDLQMKLKRKEASRLTKLSSWALSAILVILLWTWQVLGLKQCHGLVEASLKETGLYVKDAERALESAQNMWKEKMVPMEDRFRHGEPILKYEDGS